MEIPSWSLEDICGNRLMTLTFSQLIERLVPDAELHLSKIHFLKKVMGYAQKLAVYL